MKAVIKYTLIIIVLALCPILFLLISYLSRLKELSGDFTRDYRYEYLDKKVFDLKYNSYYIAGAREDQIFLANHSTRPKLTSINANLTDTQTIKIKLQNVDRRALTNYEFIIDSAYFYICYGEQHLVLGGRVGNWVATPIPIRSPFFHECVPLSPNSMVYRYTSAKTNENSFRKESFDRDSIEGDRILEKQVDGRFCTSGHLEYNKTLNVFTYVYAYRNQIIVLDTNLMIIKKFKTIDHIDSARFEVSDIISENKSVITKPTILVNPKCTLYKQYLLVNSKIMGRHEDNRQFERTTVIDIYDIQKASYVYSIRLPNISKSNISQVKVINGSLYVMLGRYLQKYNVILPE